MKALPIDPLIAEWIRPDAFECRMTGPQEQRAKTVGTARHHNAMRDRKPGFYGNTNENSPEEHYRGACAEVVGVDYLGPGVEWNPLIEAGAQLRVNGVKLPDAYGPVQPDGKRLEIDFRSGRLHKFRLITHPDDPACRAFVLVVGEPPVLYIQGWLWGREARRESWWEDPKGGRPAYFAPTRMLRPIRELAALCKETVISPQDLYRGPI